MEVTKFVQIFKQTFQVNLKISSFSCASSKLSCILCCCEQHIHVNFILVSLIIL